MEEDDLLDAIEQARHAVISRAEALTLMEVDLRPTEDSWSVAEIVEHLVLAEGFGVVGLWQAVEEVRAGEGGGALESSLASRSIDDIFAGRSGRVEAPPMVVPQKRGRPAGYWLARLRGNAALLEELACEMKGVGLENVVLDHHIVGPLNGRQRLQFFRWHLERHTAQIDRTVQAAASARDQHSP